MNIRSLLNLNKRKLLADLNALKDYDLVLLNEIWLTDNLHDYELHLHNYNIERSDRITALILKHGGVLAAVEKST